MQQNEEQFEKQKRWAYKRAILGALIGFAFAFFLGITWCVSKNQINPIAGLGLIVLSVISAVFGSLLSLISKKWKTNDF
jgi:CDP-diglyceride synthetase